MTSRMTVDISPSWLTQQVRRARAHGRVRPPRLLSPVSSSTISSEAITCSQKDSKSFGRRWEEYHVLSSSGRSTSPLHQQYPFRLMVGMLCSLLGFETSQPPGQVIENGMYTRFSLLIFLKVMSRRFGSI